MRNHGVVVAIALAGIVGCGGKEQPARSDLTVSGSPTGKLEGQPRVVATFSRPMVARERVNKPVDAPPLTLSPPIDGRATWIDPSTLVLVPTQSLPVSTKFIATIPAGTRALDGNALGEAHRFEFFTERLSGSLEVIGESDRARPDQVVKLTFNHEVPFEQITQHCGFDAGKGRRAVKLAPDAAPGPAKVYSVVPASPLALDTAWTFACSPELRGTVGNLGPEARLATTLHTYGPLRFVKLEPSGDDIVPDEDLRLSIELTNPLAEPYQVSLAPEVPGFPQRCHALGGEEAGLSCAVQLDARTSYTLTIAGTQKDVFGQTIDKPQVVKFRTTDAEPTISVESGYFVAELKRPVLPVWTRNVKEMQVRVVDVTPATFHRIRPKLDWWETQPADLSETKLVAKDRKVAIAGEKNKWGQRPIDPAELVGRKPGPGMYYIEVGSAEVDKSPFEDGGRAKVLVNFTDIGVVSKLSPTRGLVWATRLSTGKPLPGASVSVRDGAGKVTWTGTTDAMGVATLPGTDKLVGRRAAATTEDDEEDGGEEEDPASELRVFVQHQGDFTMVNPRRSGGLSAWAYNVSVDYDRAPTRLRGFLHTDRGLYRAGEKVHVKGLARVTRLGEPLAVPTGAGKVKVEVEGPTGKTFAETEARLSAFGGFWFDLDLPEDARLGDYVIRARLPYGVFTRAFTVEAYRPATFEVAGKATQSRVVRRGTIDATISANYLYGAPLRTGNVEVAVHMRPRRVRFPQHAGFQFLDERRYDDYYDESEHSQSLVTEDHVALDAQGNAKLAVAVGPNDVYTDADLLIRASVAAPSNEVINKTFTVPYFRSRTYFGVKAPGYFLDVGKPARFQIISVAPDGKLVAGPAKVTIKRRDWNCVWEDWGYRGSYQCKDTSETLVDKTIQLTAGAPAELELTPAKGGDYWITVEGATDEAATASLEVYAWGDGGGAWRSTDSLAMDLVADKKEYNPGDTATLILKTDLAEATGLVTIERDGVIEQRLFELTPTTKHLSVPITDAFAPNVYVSVALVQRRMGDGPRGKPRMRMGLINLPVRPRDNRLAVTVETDRKDYRPGAKVTATIKVTDQAGKPVSAEVSIAAADEGVLSLVGYETPDPVPTFYAPWGIAVATATQLEFIRDIPGPNLERPASGGDAAGTLRSRFVSTAVWAPAAITNAAGVATVTFEAPDNLTAFRVMAVAADRGQRFGSGDKRFTVSKPLQLHQAMPRFLDLGDALQGGVVVHNETGKAGTATVTLATDAHVTAKAGTERSVQVPAGGRVPVLFDLAAADVGEAVLGFRVTMNGEHDGLELKLPVRHPSPIRTHHVAHGATKDPAEVALALPPDTIPGSAEVVISIDPDGLAGIEDGLRELVGYPYGCLEQTTSKVIPMIAVRDLAESLQLAGLAGDKLDGFVKAGVAKIGRHQTPYGGFSLWPGGEPEAYYTAYALWGLHLAKQAGYAVDAQRITDGLAYLRNDGKAAHTSRPYYSEAGHLGSQAFALHVRAVLGDKDPQAATTLLANPALPIYGKAFLARALAAGTSAKDPAVVKLVGELADTAAAAAKTGALIQEPADKAMRAYMSSSMRTTAIVLETLVALDPKNAAIPPLVRVLMQQRRASRYLDTQENLYGLLALTSYARSVAAQAPSVTVELGDQKLISGTLAGKQRLRVASAPLAGNAALKIVPRGEVHYSVDIRHRNKLETLKPEAHGITLTREYLDEAGKPKTTFQVGDVVLVRLTAELPDSAAHFMVSDPLPAGFEALNTRLATVGTAGIQQTQSWGTYREMHDDRVDFAAEYVYRGKRVYEYMIRAIASGTFIRPPAVAELMYEPDVFSRTALDTLEVKAK